MATCEKCGATGVVAMPTVYGRTMVVSEKPSATGTIAVEDGRVRVLGNGQAENARARGEELRAQHICRRSG